jgi:hypothetical protein
MAEGPHLESSVVYRRSTEVVSRQVGAESILVPIRQNVGNLDYVYTLSPVAARVWALLDGRRSLHDLVTEICDEFEVDAETAEADLTTLLTDLEGAALISREPSGQTR